MGRYTCAYNCEHAGDSDVKFFKWVNDVKLQFYG